VAPQRTQVAHQDSCLELQNGFLSAYHHFFSECQGEEKRPTHYFYHHKNRGYHIDYVFLPDPWANGIEKVEVGKYSEWAKVSDHVPVIVEVAPTKINHPPFREMFP